MKERAEIVIIGGGIMGLGIAYHLALRGQTDVVVVEREYLNYGASGRNGGGVRMQWSSELNIRLMQESIELCRHLAQELDINVWFRQGGYLFLARNAAERAAMEKNVALQNRCGVPTRILSPGEARTVVPELDTADLVCAAHNPRDGVVFPWPFLWGYAKQAEQRGVEIWPRTGVVGIDRSAKKGQSFTVHTTRGKITCKRILNAAGAWSPEVARLVGVELPNRPHRHEILSTEPLKPFLDPLVACLGSGLYFSQSLRGEIVTGISVPDHDDGSVKLGSRLRFLRLLGKELVRWMPILADVKVLRQWAGPYDVSPDRNPILGEPAGLPGFFLCCGFVGHGFMMAPVISKLYAEWLTDGPRHEVFERCTLDRFTTAQAAQEEMILG